MREEKVDLERRQRIKKVGILALAIGFLPLLSSAIGSFLFSKRSATPPQLPLAKKARYYKKLAG